MASWDGSYYGPEDQNFYAYSNQGNAARNWNYYPQNGTNITANVSNMSHDPLTNTYQDPRTASHVQYTRPQPFFENNRSPNLPPFKCKSGHSNDKLRYKNYHGKMPFVPQHMIDPSIVENSNLQPTAGEFIPNSFKMMHNVGTILPSNSRDNVRMQSENFDSSSQQSENFGFGHDAGASKLYQSDNRNKRDKKERKYDNKKGDNYKQRDSQDGQYHNANLYKNSVRNQNPKNRKFQNDRYSNTRQYPDNGRNYTGDKDGDRKKWTSHSGARENGSQYGEEEDAQSVNEGPNKYHKNSMYENPAMVWNPRHENARQFGAPSKHYSDRTSELNHSSQNTEEAQTAGKNVRRYFNDDRGERYRDRRERYGEKYEPGAREKKSNYSDYNGSKNSYEREERGERAKDKDKQKDRDNARDGKDKDFENWRHKSDDDDKGSNLKRTGNRRYETGKSLRVIQSLHSPKLFKLLRINSLL